MDCDREDFFFLFFLKNDGWKPAARFITYEFEQLLCLLLFFLFFFAAAAAAAPWMESTSNTTAASVRRQNKKNPILFLSSKRRAKIQRNDAVLKLFFYDYVS